MKFIVFPARVTLVLIACFLIVAAGCGRGGVERHSLSGNVTFQGNPVPTGRIIFEPDASKGNDGPQGVAMIENGRYSTDKFGRGAISGPLIVRIAGFGGGNSSADQEQSSASPKPLFPIYTTKIELKEGSSSFDFEIPASSPPKR